MRRSYWINLKTSIKYKTIKFSNKNNKYKLATNHSVENYFNLKQTNNFPKMTKSLSKVIIIILENSD